jgi:hypothetical protein
MHRDKLIVSDSRLVLRLYQSWGLKSIFVLTLGPVARAIRALFRFPKIRSIVARRAFSSKSTSIAAL